MTFFSALHFLGCGVFCVYDGQGNIVRSIDILAQKEYNYEHDEEERITKIDDSVCGIIYNDKPFYFQKNLQGDIIAITDNTGKEVARYTYDAWGVCTITQDISDCNIATINPFRYRGYYYDEEIGLYYLQSRYYNPTVGRFVNGDEVEFVCITAQRWALSVFVYSGNNPVSYFDETGYWPKYTLTSKGFNVPTALSFLSREYCLLFARYFIKKNYDSKTLFTKKYKKMDALRIAQEIWAHALGYYITKPLQAALKIVKISSTWLNDKVNRFKEINVNNDDKHSWIYACMWWVAYALRTAVLLRTTGTVASFIHV